MIIYFSKVSKGWTIEIGEDELTALLEILLERDQLADCSEAKMGHTGEDILCLILSLFITISENDTGSERLSSLSRATLKPG